MDDQWFSCNGNNLPEYCEEVEIRLRYGGDNNLIRGFYDFNVGKWIHDWYTGDPIYNPICWRYIAS